MPQVTNPPDPHDGSIESWVAWMQGTLIKTLADIAESEPNPADAARRILNDIRDTNDSSVEAARLAALNASSSLYNPPP